MGAKDISNRYGVRPAGEQLMKKTVGFLCFALLVRGRPRARQGRDPGRDRAMRRLPRRGGNRQGCGNPNLAGQHDRYLVTQLQNFRSGKRPHKEMRYMSRHITDEEIEALGAILCEHTALGRRDPSTPALDLRLVGVAASLAHYSVLIALVEGARWAPVPATLIGYVVGGVVSYALNRQHTFASDRPTPRRPGASRSSPSWAFA